jgi:hypothetical protein
MQESEELREQCGVYKKRLSEYLIITYYTSCFATTSPTCTFVYVAISLPRYRTAQLIIRWIMEAQMEVWKILPPSVAMRGCRVLCKRDKVKAGQFLHSDLTFPDIGFKTTVPGRLVRHVSTGRTHYAPLITQNNGLR